MKPMMTNNLWFRMPIWIPHFNRRFHVERLQKAKTHSASFKFSFHPKTSLRQSKIGYLCNVMSLSMLPSKKSFKERWKPIKHKTHWADKHFSAERPPPLFYGFPLWFNIKYKLFAVIDFCLMAAFEMSRF